MPLSMLIGSGAVAARCRTDVAALDVLFVRSLRPLLRLFAQCSGAFAQILIVISDDVLSGYTSSLLGNGAPLHRKS